MAMTALGTDRRQSATAGIGAAIRGAVSDIANSPGTTRSARLFHQI